MEQSYSEKGAKVIKKPFALRRANPNVKKRQERRKRITIKNF